MHTDIADGPRSFEGFAFGPSFEAEVERILHRLRARHAQVSLITACKQARISLFAVKVGSLDRVQTLALARRAFTRIIGPTGPLPNGHAGVLYAGPRPVGQNSDQKLERWMIDEIKLTVFRHPEFHAATSIDLTAVHRCLDEVHSLREILNAVMWDQMICRRCEPLQMSLNPLP